MDNIVVNIAVVCVYTYRLNAAYEGSVPSVLYININDHIYIAQLTV